MSVAKHTAGYSFTALAAATVPMVLSHYGIVSPEQRAHRELIQELRDEYQRCDENRGLAWCLLRQKTDPTFAGGCRDDG